MSDAPRTSPFRQSAAPELPPVAVARRSVASRALWTLVYAAPFVLLVAGAWALSALHEPGAVGWGIIALLALVAAWDYQRRVGAHLVLYPDRVERYVFGRVTSLPLDGLRAIRIFPTGPDGGLLDLTFADGRRVALRAWPIAQLRPFEALVPALTAAVLERVRQGDAVEFRERPGQPLRSLGWAAVHAVTCLAALAFGLSLNEPAEALFVLFALTCFCLGGVQFYRAWLAGGAGVMVTREGVRRLRRKAALMPWGAIDNFTVDRDSVRVNGVDGSQFVALTAMAQNHSVLAALLPALRRERERRA
ncbi:MAG: hypothetical protein JWM10_4845 [Myxococcaceae bacterium]|nr:hypothetical protein [Myxococcaceae bacterium]